ncbi:metallohydrolase [Leptospira noumeaensis]|uniref:Metallohydrolase n=1 Tax=Leptospira noumeaensis TaxID=2484964 RepID=A0A4R9I5M3_9LEPT|nr:MBL fold metallo-hydrolase [Leptospira noumeaensis]TGK81371.1 metallohydrolase [Leptospira noumeaensis]
MKQIYPDLWQTSVEHPFVGVSSHAYLLIQSTGNILFYNASLREEYTRIKDLGGIAFQYLSHRDEVSPALSEIKEVFGSKLCCHRLEEQAVEKEASVDYLFEKREILFGSIEVIPTPGHTDGSMCFLVNSAFGKRYLFTGDTIYMNNGIWESQYARGSTSDLKNSLELLRDIGSAVIISSASIGADSFKEVSAESWRSDVNNVLRTLY